MLQIHTAIGLSTVGGRSAVVDCGTHFGMDSCGGNGMMEGRKISATESRRELLSAAPLESPAAEQSPSAPWASKIRVGPQ